MIIEKCPTCGGPVKVVGKTTMHYEPVDAKLVKKLESILYCIYVSHDPAYHRRMAKKGLRFLPREND